MEWMNAEPNKNKDKEERKKTPVLRCREGQFLIKGVQRDDFDTFRLSCSPLFEPPSSA